MDLMHVCGPSSSPGLAEYFLGAALGFLITARMWAHQRSLARRPAGRRVLSI
jgi:hypothetical protein